MSAQVSLSTPNTLLITGDLNFQTASDVYQQSRQLINGQDNLTIDLGAVEKSDSAGLAALVEFLKFAKYQKKQINFINAQDQLLAMAKVAGLTDVLNLTKK